jgi:hypothetical protein
MTDALQAARIRLSKQEREKAIQAEMLRQRHREALREAVEYPYMKDGRPDYERPVRMLTDSEVEERVG